MPSQAGVASFYYSGQGIMMLATRDANGAAEGFRNVGNVSELTLNIDNTVFEHKESSTGARGIDLRIQQEVNAQVTAVLESITAENLAVAIVGGSTANAASSVVAENVTAYEGKTVALEHMDVSNVVVNGSGGTPTHVENTDYTVNPEHGSLNIISSANGGSITDASTIEVNYDYADYNTVEALTQAAPERWLRFEGLNTAKGNEPVVIDIFRFQADPLNDFPLINDEIAQLTLEGSALLDANRTVGSQYFEVKLKR